jgi:hypothetical protein
MTTKKRKENVFLPADYFGKADDSMSESIKAEHTPGPWKYHYDADGDHVILSDSGTIIAVTGGDGYVMRLIDEANARLLSAAPEMLEALNEFLAYSECHCTRTNDCAFCMGEAAIKKAQGEE